MSIAIIMSFSSKNWDADWGRASDIRDIFNVHLGFPERNPNPFGNKELVFDENANLIRNTMSEHILKSFGNNPWSADPELTRGLRSVFNACM